MVLLKQGATTILGAFHSVGFAMEIETALITATKSIVVSCSVLYNLLKHSYCMIIRNVFICFKRNGNCNNPSDRRSNATTTSTRETTTQIGKRIYLGIIYCLVLGMFDNLVLGAHRWKLVTTSRLFFYSNSFKMPGNRLKAVSLLIHCLDKHQVMIK